MAALPLPRGAAADVTRGARQIEPGAPWVILHCTYPGIHLP